MATISETYGLHQWVGSDPVRRTEINENFTLLEQAISNRRTYHALGSAGPSAAGGVLNLDLSNVDWSRWHEVIVEVSCADTLDCFVTANGETAEGNEKIYESMNTFDPISGNALGVLRGSQRGRIQPTVFRDPTAKLTAYCYSGRYISAGAQGNISYSGLQSLTLRGRNGSLAAGITMTAWGVD